MAGETVYSARLGPKMKKMIFTQKNDVVGDTTARLTVDNNACHQNRPG